MALHRHGVASASIVLAVATASLPAAAAPVRHVVMEWSQDDPACIAAADLTSMVERTLGRAVFHADASPFATLHGGAGRAGPSRFEAHVALTDAGGKILAQRTLTTTGECGRLDESIAVVVTLMIDGLEETPAPLQIPPAPPRPPPAPVPEPPEPPPVPQRAPLTLSLGMGAGLSSSLLPGVVPSFALRGEIAGSSFVSAALTMRVHALSSALIGGAGGRFNAVTGELAACPAWSSGRIRLGGCAGLGGGVIEGSYVNLSEGTSLARPLVLASVLPFLAVRLGGPVWARVEAGAWFPLLRERWGFLDAQNVFKEVFRPAPVVPAATFTIELQAGS